MILLSISMAAALAAKAPEQTDLTLSSDYSFALISGIESRVGGKFIVTGLAGADSICASTHACVTGRNVIESTSGATIVGAVENVGDLANNTRIHGSRPAAVVSLRSAEWYKSALRVTLSVYDPATGRWSDKVALINTGSIISTGNWFGMRPRLTTWADAAEFAHNSRR